MLNDHGCSENTQGGQEWYVLGKYRHAYVCVYTPRRALCPSGRVLELIAHISAENWLLSRISRATCIYLLFASTYPIRRNHRTCYIDTLGYHLVSKMVYELRRALVSNSGHGSRPMTRKIKERRRARGEKLDPENLVLESGKLILSGITIV